MIPATDRPSARRNGRPSSRRKAPPTLLKLDLACGQRKQEGFTGVDISTGSQADVLCDLTVAPWPFDDASAEEAFCSHFVEHLTGRQRILFMDELWRVLIPGGKATVLSPYYTSMRAWQDPTHERPVSESDFLYYNREWRETNGLSHYPIMADFDFSYGYILYPDWVGRSQEQRDFAIRHYWNVVSDIQVILTKRPSPTA